MRKVYITNILTQIAWGLYSVIVIVVDLPLQTRVSYYEQGNATENCILVNSGK